MGHRIAVMRAGKLQQVGTPLEVYERPANVFVAQFIGTPPMNLVQATVVDATLRASAFALPLPFRLEEGRQLVVGIRPEHIGRVTSAVCATIAATVDMVEPIGHESIVYTSAGEEKLVAIFEPRAAPRVGERVALTVDAAKVHLFDAASEQRLSSQP